MVIWICLLVSSLWLTGWADTRHGEIASSVAARTMAEHLIKEVYQSVISPNRSPIDSLHEIMEEGVRKAQQSVVEIGAWRRHDFDRGTGFGRTDYAGPCR